jgi:hypothetical protein
MENFRASLIVLMFIDVMLTHLVHKEFRDEAMLSYPGVQEMKWT